MSDRARVFIIERNTRFNVKPAEKHGTLIHVFDSDEGITGFNTDLVRSQTLERVRGDNFDPERDLLAVTGNASLVAVVTAVMLSRYGRLRLLMFDAKTSQYIERALSGSPEAATTEG